MSADSSANVHHQMPDPRLLVQANTCCRSGRSGPVAADLAHGGRGGGRGGGLVGRRAGCDVLDGLAEAVRAGESRVLVVHGESGVGSHEHDRPDLP
jgi:hypothetical protein